MNFVAMSGRMATDPELRTTKNGKTCATFKMAVRRDYKNADGTYDADFFPVVLWGQSAEFVHKYAPKGREVSVSGRVQTRSYDAQDGSKRYVTEVIADHVELHGAKQEPEQKTEQKQGKGEFTEIAETDDLPF